MADPDRDERVTQAYRALGGEEPPAALDAAILAAARRRGTRWHAPVAAAAALVLAVGVALVVEREESRKAEEEVSLAPQVMDAPSTAAPAREPGSPVLAEAGKPADRGSRAKDQVPLRQSAPDADQARPAPLAKADVSAKAASTSQGAGEHGAQVGQQAASTPAEPAAADDLSSQGARREHRISEPRETPGARGAGAEESTLIGESPGVTAAGRADEAPVAAARGSASPAPAMAGAFGEKIEAKPQTPEQWLARIAKLREAGRQKEADESLAEFRRRYPEYEIPEAMRARVLPR